MAATIRDIKQQTGLSLATISKYLNGGNVLPENRVKIEASIKDLHYEVNEIARGLVTNKTKTVGVIVYSVESLFNGTLLRYIGDSLRRAGYGLLICDSCNDESVEARNVHFLISKKVDGIIVIPVASKTDFLKPAKTAQIPVVLLDRSLPGDEYDVVKINNYTAAERATRVLLENGHTKIAVISSKIEYTGKERYKGFMEAMRQAGLKVPENYQKKGRHSIEFGHESMKQLLSLKNPPTAVFMTNYEVTLGAVMALNETGAKCPDDISMLGFDDLIMSHVLQPRMYMVVQPMREMSEKAVELLLHHIDDPKNEIPVEIVMSTRIEEGNSIKNNR